MAKNKNNANQRSNRRARAPPAKTPGTNSSTYHSHQPRVVSCQPGHLRVQGSCLAHDVWTNVTDFVCKKFRINPGNNEIFRTLCGTASAYDQYKFHKLAAIYRTGSGTTSKGFIGMCFDSDVQDESPSDWSGLTAQTPQANCALWQNARLDVPKEMLDDWRYVFVGENNATKFSTEGGNEQLDMKTFDIGAAHFAIDVGASELNATLGTIILEYDVEFRFQTAAMPRIVKANTFKLEPTAPTATAPFKVGGTVGGRLPVDHTDDTLSFKQLGKYLLDIHSTWGTTSAGASTWTTGSGVTATHILDGLTKGSDRSDQWVIEVKDLVNATFSLTNLPGTTMNSAISRITGYRF